MKRLIQMGFVLVALALPASAQIFGPTASMRSGLSNPLTCTPSGNNVFFNRTDATFYVCDSVNHWIASGGGVAVPVTFSGATATNDLLTLQTTDDSTTHYLVRGRSSGGTVMFGIGATGRYFAPNGDFNNPALTFLNCNTCGVILSGTDYYVRGGSLAFTPDGATTPFQVDGTKVNQTVPRRITTTNGAYWEQASASELITLSTSGTTTDSTAFLLPANSVIEAVVARVTTTIVTATNWKLGDATTSGRFTAANATLAAGTTDIGLVHVDQTGAAGPKQTAAAKLRITTTGTPSAGVVRVTVFYRTFVAPTS